MHKQIKAATKMRNFLIVILCCAAQIHLTTSDMQILEDVDIDTLFEIGDMEVDLNGQKNVILLIGGTGTGKSTLSKFLRQDASLKILKNKADDFIFTDGEDKIGNLDNHMSKTLFPQVDKDEQSGALLVDCAGFEDTRHPMYDLLASFFTQKVFNRAEQIKIVVVESFERMRLSSDRTAFMRSIKQLAQLLQDDVAAFNSSIGLVATKVDSSRPDGQLENSVNVFLKATLKSLQRKRNDAERRSEVSAVQSLDRQILLVQFLSAGDRVAIFRRPDDLQSPWTLPPLRKNFIKIRDLVFQKLKYVDINERNFQVSVSPETVVYIQNDLFTVAEEHLQRILFEIGQTMIFDFKTIIESEKSAFLREHIVETFNFVLNYGGQMAKINSTQTLLEHFKHMKINSSLVQSVDLEMRKVEFLCEVVGSDVNNFRSQLTSMYGMWEKLQSNVNSHAQFFAAAALLTARSGSYEIYANLPFAANVTSENYNDFMAYLLSLNLNTSTFLATANIIPTQNQLFLLNRIKTEQMNQSIAMEKKKDFVRYSGNYVLASQIQSPDIIQGRLVIMAAQKFFIDRDLTLTDTHLTIMAPIVEVVGENRTLTLQGSSGQIVLAGRAPGLKGLDGKPGASSGDLKMHTLDVVNAQALTIRSKGGDGSDGQAGVHGTNGITSSSPKLTNNDLHGTESQIHQRVSSFNYEVTSWSSSSKNVDYASFIVFTTVSRDITRELTVTNYDGARAPTNGADGGNGGAAALPGNLKLLLKNTATLIAVQSLSGKNGEGGQGGKAGRDAATCASAAFKCYGSKENTVILVIVVTDNPYEYRCSLEHRYDCDSKFPSASGGKNGTAAVTHEMRSYKVSVTTSIENEVHEYCKVAVASAALEKGGLVNEFLDFVFSLPDAKSQLKDGICVKNQ